MSRKQLENFSEQEQRHKLGASIAGFAVSPERNATKKRQIASGKRLLKTWPDATANTP
jgi:hypothetical protein